MLRSMLVLVLTGLASVCVCDRQNDSGKKKRSLRTLHTCVLRTPTTIDIPEQEK